MLKYSICVCTYNMGDTIEIMLESIFRQIDNSYEVIVVDDGSSDNTLEVLNRLSGERSNLRIFSLIHDKDRKLGFTRNFSIQQSRGEWCIFHLDADDLIGPYIQEFMYVCETMQRYESKSILFSGKQIHAAKRDFLTELGPFRNIGRGEDRDLYGRIAIHDQWRVIEHSRFIYRLDQFRDTKKVFRKRISDIHDQVITDLRQEKSIPKYIRKIINLSHIFGIKGLLLRIAFLPFARFSAQKLGALSEIPKLELDQFLAYRKKNTKSAHDWFDILKVPKSERPTINDEVFRGPN